VAIVGSLEDVRELVAQAKRDLAEARKKRKEWDEALDRANQSVAKANTAVALYQASNGLQIGLDDSIDV
jgi:hypothetical protein